ncbi:NDP-sugar synthase [bacterium]|nr:NDP-sugar synthase [bacterium]
MDAIILSAGEGTRLRPLTLHKAKPLVPILCKPLIEHIISNLESSGIFRAVVNLWYRSEEMQGYIENRQSTGMKLFPVVEERLLGTGGGISNAAMALDGSEPVLVHNGDIFANIDFTPAIIRHRESGSAITLFVRDGAPEVTVIGGDAIDIVGKIGIEDGNKYKFTGISIWDRRALSYLTPPRQPGCAVEAIAEIIRREKGAVRIEHIGSALWSDVGTVSSYLELHRRLLSINRIYPDNFELPLGVRTDGFLCCCDGAKICAGATLKDVVLWKGSVVQPGKSIEKAVVGPFGVVRA